MIIKSLHVKNLRCIQEETLPLSALTVLVGANGTGKSSFLQALNLFYDPKPTLHHEDLCHHRDDNAVEITATFSGLSASAKEQFAKYVKDDELAVTRVIRLTDSKTVTTYHGSHLGCPDFRNTRSAPVAKDGTAEYNRLKSMSEYSDLPSVRSKADYLAALSEWEENHPDRCERISDDGQFFGFSTVGSGYLGRYTKLLLVPAVRDATPDGEDGKNSIFGELVDIVARNALMANPAIAALNQEVSARYTEIIGSTQDGGLQQLATDLTDTLHAFVPNAEVSLCWIGMPAISLPSPKATIKIGEHGYHSDIQRKGHGLQRAFIMTMLQQLDRVRSASTLRTVAEEEATNVADLIVAVEEPELYQHPDRQRHMARVLRNLATLNALNGSSTQVVYTTHSPHFVGIDRFDDLRLVRKVVAAGNTIPTACLSQTSLETIAKALAVATQSRNPSSFTADTIRGRLLPLMTPWTNEGFFAAVVVLVEGEQDRAAILAMAQVLKFDFESIGISVIPCVGKNNLDRPALIFRSLGIPTYLLWDSDEPKSESNKTNRLLLRIIGASEEDYPAFVGKDAACFKDKLETTLSEELGDAAINNAIARARAKYDVTKEDILKNPAMMHVVLEDCLSNGATCPTLEGIVKQIASMKT